MYEVIDDLHLDPGKTEQLFSSLKAEGYSEKGICYGIGKARGTILSYVGEDRRYGIMKNSVRKHSLKSGDPKWEHRLK